MDCVQRAPFVKTFEAGVPVGAAAAIIDRLSRSRALDSSWAVLEDQITIVFETITHERNRRDRRLLPSVMRGIRA